MYSSYTHIFELHAYNRVIHIYQRYTCVALRVTRVYIHQSYTHILELYTCIRVIRTSSSYTHIIELYTYIRDIHVLHYGLYVSTYLRVIHIYQSFTHILKLQSYHTCVREIHRTYVETMPHVKSRDVAHLENSSKYAKMRHVVHQDNSSKCLIFGYEVASVSMIDKIIGLFCKRNL